MKEFDLENSVLVTWDESGSEGLNNGTVEKIPLLLVDRQKTHTLACGMNVVVDENTLPVSLLSLISLLFTYK